MSIGGLAVVVWGGFRIYDNITDGQDQILDEMTTFRAQQGDMIDTLENIREHQNVQDKHMISMERAAEFYINHQKEITEEAMGDILDVILKKNGYEPMVSQ